MKEQKESVIAIIDGITNVLDIQREHSWNLAAIIPRNFSQIAIILKQLQWWELSSCYRGEVMNKLLLSWRNFSYQIRLTWRLPFTQ